MNVKVAITRIDLLWVNLYLSVRQRATWVGFAVLWALIFVVLMVYFKFPLNMRGIGTGLVASFGGAVGGAVFGLIIHLIQFFLMHGEKNGVLGEHYYEIQEAGLFERTDANEGLAKWAGIDGIHKSKRFILVRITGYLYHIIPRSAFPTEQEFEQFFAKLSERQNAV